ncbi:MAG: hypothetical protein ACT4OI_05800 [Methanobacteriota archaeon]
MAGTALYFAIAGVGLAGTTVAWLPSLLASPIGASLPSFAVAGAVHALASRLTSPAAGRTPA